jgi:hypothetical protein
MRLSNDAPVCTSSWNVTRTVSGLTTHGTVTAGHCAGIAKVDDINGSPVLTTFQAQHLGGSGDLEWHTVAAPLPARFHADPSESRSVVSVKTRWSRNDRTCVFGRTTGVRICDAVFRTSVNVRFSGVTLRRMVAVTNDNSQGGDSGGGWSFGRAAHGVHGGSSPINGAERDLFSRAERLPNALGVEVRLAP